MTHVFQFKAGATPLIKIKRHNKAGQFKVYRSEVYRLSVWSNICDLVWYEHTAQAMR